MQTQVYAGFELLFESHAANQTFYFYKVWLNIGIGIFTLCQKKDRAQSSETENT